MNKQTVVIESIKILSEQGWSQPTSLLIENGKITEVGEGIQHPNAQHIDAQGQYILPGIIDLHGDAFERHIAPRAGTHFPLELALAANDASLVASGITTFYYSITDGFEPGPRSRDTVRELLLALEKLMPRFSCQARIHIRHEKVNVEKHDELVDWILSGRIHLLSLNDHLPPLNNERKIQRYLAGMRRRVSMSVEDINQFLLNLQQHRELGEQQATALAEIAAQQGISLASHDDETLEEVSRSISLGVSIAEFPMSEAAARQCQKGGAAVLMGSPNLVRGGSHVGAISVKEAIEHGVVDILCSDYHYPSLFSAPFTAVNTNNLSLFDAWKFVSENPAKAAGLGASKGKIEMGYDADFILLSEIDGSPLSISSTWVKGKQVFAKSRLA
ncbi:alpha-D-ribose 1-methylphosphonate 5-triphosphate diphosphatase [Agarivorans sp. 1_MG-2023]|uniref:alpha-D-ribose 1-methylphosphonate 5-triphosphate diphosphatase n=1 Tax=Agarivorans sp. 1_MG-2023 TaxID=3062634 RepID=UPI0026E454B2|nr:alpha-D-ribose 1-methylphosphonate 5-triphosphate diphosphatase [Agarivorans sp. 1_MG-2023]MDO6762303.1 alpha-D-ribose 1-methylphosphonate 5-triphosphate diphosphatase [Agarivorans sp. 1_MG-2023]